MGRLRNERGGMMDKLFDSYIDELTRIGIRRANNLLLGRDGARDITNDAILKLWLNPNRPSDKKELFRLFKLTLHSCYVDHVRKVVRGPIGFGMIETSLDCDFTDLLSSEEGLPTAGQAKSLIEKQAAGDFQRAIDRLPEQQNLIFTLRYFEGLTIKDTAEVLGIKPGTVKAHEFRTRATLKKALTGK